MFLKTRNHLFWLLISGIIIGIVIIMSYFFLSTETHSGPGSNPAKSDSAAITKQPVNKVPGDSAR